VSNTEPTIRDMAEAAHLVFARLGYSICVEGVLRVPTASEIATLIGKHIGELLANDSRNRVYGGRIIVTRDRELQCFDVSIDLGSFGLDADDLLAKEGGGNV